MFVLFLLPYARRSQIRRALSANGKCTRPCEEYGIKTNRRIPMHGGYMCGRYVCMCACAVRNEACIIRWATTTCWFCGCEHSTAQAWMNGTVYGDDVELVVCVLANCGLRSTSFHWSSRSAGIYCLSGTWSIYVGFRRIFSIARTKAEM